PPWLTVPTMAWPPSLTVTWCTLMVCSPEVRYFLSASICMANVRASLFSMVEAESCWSIVSTWARRRAATRWRCGSPPSAWQGAPRWDPLARCPVRLRSRSLGPRLWLLAASGEIGELIDDAVAEGAVAGGQRVGHQQRPHPLL